MHTRRSFFICSIWFICEIRADIAVFWSTAILMKRGRMDPAELSFESLAAEQRQRGGPAWQAAIDAGLDVTLIERNLALTPDERLMQLDAMLQLIHEARR